MPTPTTLATKRAAKITAGTSRGGPPALPDPWPDLRGVLLVELGVTIIVDLLSYRFVSVDNQCYGIIVFFTNHYYF
jgi:hypothetical protein